MKCDYCDKLINTSSFIVPNICHACYFDLPLVGYTVIRDDKVYDDIYCLPCGENAQTEKHPLTVSDISNMVDENVGLYSPQCAKCGESL